MPALGWCVCAALFQLTNEQLRSEPTVTFSRRLGPNQNKDNYKSPEGGCNKHVHHSNSLQVSVRWTCFYLWKEPQLKKAVLFLTTALIWLSIFKQGSTNTPRSFTKKLLNADNRRSTVFTPSRTPGSPKTTISVLFSLRCKDSDNQSLISLRQFFRGQGMTHLV